MKNEIRAGEVCVYIPAKDIARVHITQRVIIRALANDTSLYL